MCASLAIRFAGTATTEPETTVRHRPEFACGGLPRVFAISAIDTTAAKAFGTIRCDSIEDAHAAAIRRLAFSDSRRASFSSIDSVRGTMSMPH